MGNLTIVKRIAAGIMSAALAVCFTGNITPPAASVVAAEETEGITFNPDTGMYEYEFKDAYVYSIESYMDSGDDYIEIGLIPTYGRGYADMGNLKTIVLLNQISGFEATYDYNREYQLAQKIKPQSRINIKFAAYNEYSNLMSTRYSYRDDYFIVSSIVSVKDKNEHYYGDINDDGVVDSFDVITYRKYLAGTLSNKLSEDQFLNADVNYDTVIDENDLRQVIDFTLGSCKNFNTASNIGSVRLDNTVSIESAEGAETDEEFAKAEMSLGVEMLKKCYAPDSGENLLLSPLSVSSALSMTANGADGETLSEMEKLLGNGLNIDQLNEYMAYYIKGLPDKDKEKVYLADSIWFRDDPSFKVYDSFLEANKKYYNAEIYKSPFDDSIVNDVNSWVNSNTKGMIPSLIQKGNIKDNTMMLLINTLYFEAEWANPYKSSYDGVFTGLDGNEYPIKEMHSMEGQYFDLGNADAFKKPYANGDYSFVGILPHSDVDFNEYISELDAEALCEGLKQSEDMSNIDLYVMIPKFKYGYSKSLRDILPALGMEKAFDPLNADFSRINDLSVEDANPLYIDDVLHKTKIEVTEKGTKAAAVTAVMMGAGAAYDPRVRREIHIELNRPFVYMIVDKNNVPLFIGAATQLETT